ncbi:MAG TPA: SMC-Scp complex subunit ScpB [Longimicrobiales bacterium]|nr:SMC-Scp complex subunit ScpB [Longimicrobiales bacterium]
MRLTQIIEALLFASDAPLSAADLSRVDERLDEDTVEAVIQELRAEYELSERSFQIYEVGGGFQLLTRPEFVTVLERYDSVPQPSRLSAPALEVLAIIAYRQPLGRAEIEDIRGVGSSGVLRTLQERSLIEPVARGEGLGRPLLYGTTQKFLEHFGFRSLEDLPRPDELPVVLRDRTPVTTLPLEQGDAPADSAAANAEVGEQTGSETADAPAVETAEGSEAEAEASAPDEAAPAVEAASDVTAPEADAARSEDDGGQPSAADEAGADVESQSFDGDVAEEVDPGTVTLDAGPDGESEDEMSEVADASPDADAELDEVS